MAAFFEMPLQSETLDADEVSYISGCARRNEQIEWLKRHHWVFIQNRAGMPIVGRMYARLKLAGINPASLAPSDHTEWQIDISNIR